MLGGDSHIIWGTHNNDEKHRSNHEVYIIIDYKSTHLFLSKFSSIKVDCESYGWICWQYSYNPTREKIYSQSRRYIMWEIGGKPKSIKFREWESDDAPYLPHATNDK